MSKRTWRNFGLCAAKCLAWVMAAVMFTVSAGQNGHAAESSVIENVTVTIKTTYGGQGEIPDPEITVNGKGCILGDVQYRTAYEKWQPGKKVRLDININAEEGKVFPASLTRTQCKVSGADYVSAKALDNSTLQVKVDYVPVTVLGDAETAGWSSRNKHQAVWKSVEYAPGYSLVLYGGDKVIRRMTVDTNSVDLTKDMDDDELVYYYEVKAIPVTSEEKKYLKEGNFVPSTSQELDWEEEEARRTEDGGAVRGNQYVLPDGTKQTNTWKKISGDWYYFGPDGNMVKGWQVIGGFWYYMDNNGKMLNGWVNPEGDSWYYLFENGGMAVGWIQPEPGVWYYMDISGRMQRGWTMVDNVWYYLNSSGRMQTGWLSDGGNLYYLYGNGAMAANVTIDGHTLGWDGKALN